MRYAIVCSSNMDDLINRVNKHMAEQWKPQGGVFTFEIAESDDMLHMYFGQAMIFHEA